MASKTYATERRFLPQMVERERKESSEQRANASNGNVKLTELSAAIDDVQRFRKFVIRSKPLKGCTGSALVEAGGTRVSCAVMGPKEQQSGESAVEGILTISLHGCIDPALRYSVDHALRAVVCLKKLARTEIAVELNVLSDDGGALAVCLLAAGIAIASANIEMFDTLLACQLLIPAQLNKSLAVSVPPRVLLDPDQRTISAHGHTAASLTLAVIPSLGQVVLAEFGGHPLPPSLVQRVLPLAYEHCVALWPAVRHALLEDYENADEDNASQT